MNIVLGIVIGLAIGIAAVQLGAIVIGPAVDIALSIVAVVLLLAAIAAALLFVFREAIFRKLRLKADAKVDHLRQPATAVVEALDRKDTVSAVSASIELGTIVLAWQSQIRMRQGIIAGLTALLAVLAAVLGSSLLVRQNELLKGQTDLLRKQGIVQRTLLEQQNKLITEQTYSMRAQTTAALLTGIRSDEISRSDAALLAAFGEIGFDSLEILASGYDQTAESVRSVFVAIAPRLRPQQAVAALKILVENDQEEYQDFYAQKATELEGDNSDRFSAATRRWLTVKDFRSGDRLEAVRTLTHYVGGAIPIKMLLERPRHARFAEARGVALKSDFNAVSQIKRTELISAIASFYVVQSVMTPDGDVGGELGSTAAYLCHGRGDHAPNLHEQLTNDFKSVANVHMEVALHTVFFVSTFRWCFGTNPPSDGADDHVREHAMRVAASLSSSK